MDNAFARMPLPHFLRWLLLNGAIFVALCFFIIPGLIWQASINKKTGYRTVDLWLLIVPIAANIVSTRTQWRYCSKVKYWEPQVTSPVAVPVAA